MKNFRFALLVAALLIPFAAVVANDSTQDNNSALDTPQTAIEVQQTIDELTGWIDSWHAAVLKTQRNRADQYLKHLQSTVQKDITASEKSVRFYARQAALDDEDPDQVGESIHDVSFKRAHANLKAKKILFKSFNKTDAFSNKYRLISNYVEMLKRQLESPGVKMATKDDRE